MTAAFLLLTVFVTAAVSGLLGMAGGLLLFGGLLLVLPATATFVVHGLLQLLSNGWRAVLQRRDLRWVVVGWYSVGALVAALLVALVRYTPDKGSPTCCSDWSRCWRGCHATAYHWTPRDRRTRCSPDCW